MQGLAATLARSLDELDRETALRVAAALERSALHLGELVRSFGDARGLEPGELVLRLEPTSLAELVRETVEELRPVLAERPVALELDEAPRPSRRSGAHPPGADEPALERRAGTRPPGARSR